MNTPFLRRIQSFVRRDSRMTDAQRHAFETFWPQFGLNLESGIIRWEKVFDRTAPCILEIGFGMGHSLVAMAEAHPDQNFIGIETHLPGIGALLAAIDARNIQNIRVFYADAVEVFTRCIPDESIDVLQIFFPDPWPKRRHHKRRLLGPLFIQSITGKMKPDGTLHIATDWEDYAIQVMKTISQNPFWKNLAGEGQFSNRSIQRPVLTKFERRGKESGRAIFELQFVKKKVV